jgi:hypothetical protein
LLQMLQANVTEGSHDVTNDLDCNSRRLSYGIGGRGRTHLDRKK